MPLQRMAPFAVPKRTAATQTSKLSNVPAPVGGLNYRDPISQMSPLDAVVLDNMIPRQFGTEIRKGYRLHVDDVGGETKSVFTYNAANPTNNKVFAARGGNIYDVTTDPATVAVSTTGSTDNLWWTTQFSTGGDTFLLAVSPGAGYYTYSQATGWIKRTPSSLPTTTLRTVAVWKRRVFFTCVNDQKIYYLNSVDIVDGASNSFSMGGLLRNGGYVSALINWTLDAGVGIDDHLVVVGTQGDMGVWKGTDPGTAADFQLQGVWYIGPVPQYGRYFSPAGGDVLILSSLGLQQVSKLVNGQFIERDPGPAAKVQSVLNPLVQTYLNSQAWDVLVVPSSNILLISPPPSNIGTYQQFAMDLTTGSWCTLSGMRMRAAAVLDGTMYYCTNDGYVYKGLFGSKDNVPISGVGGDLVEADVQCAFNAMGNAGVLKRFSMARPVFISSDTPSVKLQVNTQYQLNPVAGSPSFTNQSVGVWSNGTWNNAIWSGSNNTYQAFVGATGIGYYGSIRMKVRGLAGTVFTSSHMMYDVGGVM